MENNKSTEYEIEIKCLDDELSEEELRQMNEDAFLDGEPVIISNWSKHFKSDE